jgi:mycofactocin precursor
VACVSPAFPEERIMLEPQTDAPVVDAAADEVVAEDLLVEEVSIDGMCGVY